ncbi:MAG: hypothetical protein AABX83_00510 [Nanoarchaeota archaeon]
MTNLEDFVKYTKEGEEIGKLAETKEKDSRAGERDKADKEIRKRAYETLKDIGSPGIDFNTETPDTISEDYVNVGINTRIGMNRQDSARTLTSNTDDILNLVKQESLEQIALAEPIQKADIKGYDEVLNLYNEYLGTKQLVEKYKAGQINDPREMQEIRSGGVKKAEREIRAKLKNAGYSKDLQDLGANIAKIAARDGQISKNYVDEGADDLIKDAESKFRDYETTKGKKITDYVKESIKNLVKGNTQEFETARSLVYQIARG